MRSKGTMKGKFKARNPAKYKGDPTNIIYRSSYELKLYRWADAHPNVIKWSSEEMAIAYRSPLDDSFHRYYPDAVVWIKAKDGTQRTVMIEVKPASQSVPPAVREKHNQNKTYLREVYLWSVNNAKWTAARKYCDARGWDFRIFTEKQLGITKNYWGKVQEP